MKTRLGLIGRIGAAGSASRPYLKMGLTMLVVTVLGLAVTPPAKAQVTAVTITPAITNNQAITQTNATITFGAATNTPCEIWQGRGVGVFVRMFADAATVSNATLTFSVSADGTNWSTTHEPTVVLPLNGTTEVVARTNLPAAYLDNARYIRVKSLACPAAAGGANMAVTNLWFVRRND